MTILAFAYVFGIEYSFAAFKAAWEIKVVNKEN